MRMDDGVCGCMVLLELPALLLELRGKKTSPFVFGCEQDGLGGGLGRFGEPVNETGEKSCDQLRVFEQKNEATKSVR